jgi:hypothetical protein
MALLGAIHSPARGADDAGEVRALIGATWDKPGRKVETNPVVVSGDYAVASWSQGDRGGRALLRRDDTGWSVVLCSGDPLKEAGWLAEAGVPQGDAERIAKDLASAEALIPADRRAKFSLFEGVVSGTGEDHSAAGHDVHSHK